jgi:hypothetical protein
MNGRASKLFYLEFALTLLTFAFCAAVCLQLFVSARQKSALSRDTASAVALAQTAAEAFKACAGDGAAVAETLGGAWSNGAVTAYYDENWRSAASGAARKLTLSITGRDGLSTARIALTLDERPLFTLAVSAAGSAQGGAP